MTTTKPLSVSSKTIADLTHRRHDNVKNKIDSMMNKRLLDHYELEKDGPCKVYQLSKRDSQKLVSVYAPQYLNRLNELWHHLENPSAAPMPVPDFTDPAMAARAWATQYEQKVQAEQRFAKARKEKGGAKLIVIQCDDDSILERVLEPLRGLVQFALKAPSEVTA